MADLTMTITRPVDPQEVHDLIWGTGALNWGWWGDAVAEERDGVAGYLFTHDGPDSEEGALDVHTWVSEQQIVDSASWFIANGFVGENAQDAALEGLGYLDAIEADNVLQRAVLGEVTFS